MIVERNPNYASAVPVHALIQLLATIDGELAEECREILRVLFDSADFSSILSTYGSYLGEALKSERLTMLHMGIDLCERAITPNYCTELPRTTLEAFLKLYCHPDTGIYQRIDESNSNLLNPSDFDSFV